VLSHALARGDAAVRVSLSVGTRQLYDLMTMGVKYQMLACTSPTQLLQVTLNHLNTLKAIVDGTPVADLVENAITLVNAVRRW
jgi:hypothetical protein